MRIRSMHRLQLTKYDHLSMCGDHPTAENSSLSHPFVRFDYLHGRAQMHALHICTCFSWSLKSLRRRYKFPAWKLDLLTTPRCTSNNAPATTKVQVGYSRAQLHKQATSEPFRMVYYESVLPATADRQFRLTFIIKYSLLMVFPWSFG